MLFENKLLFGVSCFYESRPIVLSFDLTSIFPGGGCPPNKNPGICPHSRLAMRILNVPALLLVLALLTLTSPVAFADEVDMVDSSGWDAATPVTKGMEWSSKPIKGIDDLFVLLRSLTFFYKTVGFGKDPGEAALRMVYEGKASFSVFMAVIFTKANLEPDACWSPDDTVVEILYYRREEGETPPWKQNFRFCFSGDTIYNPTWIKVVNAPEVSIALTPWHKRFARRWIAPRLLKAMEADPLMKTLTFALPD